MKKPEPLPLTPRYSPLTTHQGDTIMNNHRDNPSRHGLDRRGFLQSAGLVGAGVALSESFLRAQQAPAQLELSNTGPDKIPRKPFGRTQERVSIIGIGGYSLGDAPSLKEAIAIVHEAIDAGVNFFDNAWEYHNGKSEEWMGQALKGRRDRVFLMTKVCTHGRDKTVAMRQLDESLKRLQTDHLDLWQVHECVYDNDPERHFAKAASSKPWTKPRRPARCATSASPAINTLTSIS